SNFERGSRGPRAAGKQEESKRRCRFRKRVHPEGHRPTPWRLRYRPVGPERPVRAPPHPPARGLTPPPAGTLSRPLFKWTLAHLVDTAHRHQDPSTRGGGP